MKDLSCGTRLSLSPRSSRACPPQVITDLEENLPLLRRNAALATTPVQVLPLDWCDSELPADLPAYDVVLAADCVFWPALFDPRRAPRPKNSTRVPRSTRPVDPRLLETIERLLRREPTARAFISVTHRLDRSDRFLKRASETGWTWHAQPRPDRASAYNTDVYELRRPPKGGRPRGDAPSTSRIESPRGDL